MKLSDVYLRAAEKVLDQRPYGWGCCDCINSIVHSYSPGDSLAARGFTCLFGPTGEESKYSYWGQRWSEYPSEVNDCRILALLFASHIARDEQSEGR